MAVTAEAKVEQIRQEVAAVTRTAYLNTGTCGPLPRGAIAAMQRAQEEEWAQGRIGHAHFTDLFETVKSLKASIATVLQCDPAELALSRHTTDGMNMAIAGYPWRPGDELITPNIEHPGGLLPTFLTKRRWGTRVRIADIGVGDLGTDEFVRAFERLITPRTRMIVLSHVSYATGTILPLKEIAAMAHRHDVLVTVDGAQSYGHIPLDLGDLGVDFYACPGQKWMCGPEGTGVFYARASSIGEIEQTFVGGFGFRWGTMDYYGGSYAPAEGAARFDVGSVNVPLLLGQRASTRWIAEDVGLDWAYERIASLGAYAYRMLKEIDGVEMVTPEDRMAGMVVFTVAGIDAADLATRLHDEHNVTCRYVAREVNNPRAARITTGFYNTEEDIERLCAGVRAIRASL